MSLYSCEFVCKCVWYASAEYECAWSIRVCGLSMGSGDGGQRLHVGAGLAQHLHKSWSKIPASSNTRRKYQSYFQTSSGAQLQWASHVRILRLSQTSCIRPFLALSGLLCWTMKRLLPHVTLGVWPSWHLLKLS